MDYLNNTINTLPRERGQHLRFEEMNNHFEDDVVMHRKI